MQDDTRSKLDKVFEKHEKTKRDSELRVQNAKSKAQSFLEAFLEKREGVIRPAMEEVGEYVKAKGYDFNITTEEDGLTSGQERRAVLASIRVTFFIGERSSRIHDHPGLRCICEKDLEQVRFHKSTMTPGRGGMAGSEGDAKLEEITPEFVQNKLLSLVSKVYV